MEQVTTVIVFLLAVAGTAFILVSSIGLLRMPDLLTRMHASSKAGTLGAILVMAAVAFHFPEGDVTLRAILIILFLFMTASVAAHAIARAGYFSGVKLVDGTRYEMGDHREEEGFSRRDPEEAESAPPPEDRSAPPADDE
jgi:multicomponent Na+:H+ antiporter subunit G